MGCHAWSVLKWSRCLCSKDDATAGRALDLGLRALALDPSSALLWASVGRLVGRLASSAWLSLYLECIHGGSYPYDLLGHIQP